MSDLARDSRYDDFFPEGCLHYSDLEEPVRLVAQFARYLHKDQVAKLTRALKLGPAVVINGGRVPQVYGAEFDFAAEIDQQIQAVRALRNRLIDQEGAVIDGADAREIREAITAGSALLNTLMKSHKEIINMDRLRRLEQVVISVLQDEAPELRDRVLRRLEERLNA